MKIRHHLTYANVAATVALVGVVGGGGAYAAGVIDSGDIENNSIESRDLRNRKAVRAQDVRSNALTGKQINERKLDASEFAALAGDQGDCNPTSTDFVDCASASIRLAKPGRLLLVGTGDFFSNQAGASLTCRIAVDGDNAETGASPGETTDETNLAQTDGFATTLVTDRVSKGQHSVALRCSEPTAADGQLASASIAVLGISG